MKRLPTPFPVHGRYSIELLRKDKIMDVSLVTAAWDGIKFAKDALKTALDYKIEIEGREKILAALEKLGSTQDDLFAVRENLFRLQEENEKLRQQLKTSEDWEAQRACYKLEDTAGGAVVYACTRQDVPKHYVCPSCYAKETLQILQDRGVASGIFDCPGCKAGYYVKPRKAVTVERFRKPPRGF